MSETIVRVVKFFFQTQPAPQPEPTVSPVAVPYAHERGFSRCYLTHEHKSVRRNGATVRYFLAQDVYDGQHRWVSEKALIVNSWFTMYDGGVQ